MRHFSVLQTIRMLAAFGVLALVCAPTVAQMRIQIIPAGESAVAGAFRPAGALNDTRIGRGRRDIAYAWFSLPTNRYGHGALGDAIEAAAINVQTRDGVMLAYALKDDSVFEDLSPRLADLDGDGRDEVLVVRSQQTLGSSLMALGVRNGRLEVLAESAPTGKRFVWLNPAGIADVDGDGRQEVLAVMQPHQNGQLVVYDYVEGRFQETQRVDNVSNHVFGSRDQGMSALLDVDFDGRPDLIIPSGDRLQLRAFSFGPYGRVWESTRVTLPAAASGNFELLELGALIVPLVDGRRLRLEWKAPSQPMPAPPSSPRP